MAVTPYLTTLMLPGANSLRGMIDKLGEHKKREGDSEITETNHLVRVPLMGAACGYMFYKEFRETSTWSLSDVAIGLLKTMICGKTAWSSGEESAISKIGSIMITHALYKDILTYLPIIIVSVAGILAFLSYFVTLCKYYYISPFVVAFALTTKRVDKIINFLITGITIFFKPVLIVLFLYLALFLHHIIQDLFLVTSLTQFSVLEASDNPFDENSNSVIDFTTSFATDAIKMLLVFFGSLASCYIVWKTIMTGPDWTFKLLGLDKDSDNTIVQGLAYKEAATKIIQMGAKNQKAVSNTTKIANDFAKIYGTATRELFTQFFVRIYQEIPNCILASFSTLKYVNSANFVKFRQNFQCEISSKFSS